MNRQPLIINGSPRKSSNKTIVTDWVCSGLQKGSADKKNACLDFLSEHMRRVAAGFEEEIQKLLVPSCPPAPRDKALCSDIREKAISFGEQAAQDSPYRTSQEASRHPEPVESLHV